MSEFTRLKNYVNRKAAGKLSIVKTANGNITVFKQVFDEDGVLLPDLQVIVDTTSIELNQRLTDLQKEKQIINNFMTAEGIV